MPFDVVLVQLGLAICLFWLLNWIGRHSYSVGYMQISMFLRTEEAPAFNFVFRVLGPVVFLFICAAVLYALRLDRYVDRIYLVSVYYVVIRLVFNVATNRARLLNWVRQVLYWFGILSLSYLAYQRVISTRANLLPDFSTFANELWIIIMIFLFQTMNQLRFSSEGTERRKSSYLKSRLAHFQSRYGPNIETWVSNPKLISLVYAIVIYEDFNRPQLVRWVENLVFRIRQKPMSLGVMQVRTSKLITDASSISLGVRKILEASQKSIGRLDAELSDPGNQHRGYSEWMLDAEIERDILKDYNPDDKYINEVSELAELLRKDLIKSDGHSLAPKFLIDKAEDQLAP